MQPTKPVQQIHELLGKLVRRSDSARDLYPLNTRLQFLNLASSLELDLLLPDENLSGLHSTQLLLIRDRLESWWQVPALTRPHLNRELLRLSPVSGPELFPSRNHGESAPCEIWSDLMRQPQKNTAPATHNRKKIPAQSPLHTRPRPDKKATFQPSITQ